MKKVLIILGVVLVVVIGAVVAVGIFAGKKFEPYAEKVLVACREGKYEQVYADAAEGFRKGTTLEEFRAFMEARRRVLGEFKKIEKTTGAGISASTESGTVGTLHAVLAYEKGQADGEFQFQKDGDEWRLLHAKITFDEKLMPGPDRAALEPLGRELLGLYDESKFTALYQRFSKPLQDAWKAEAYEPQIRDLHEKLGKSVEATLRETKDEDGGKVRLVFAVQFEHGPGEAKFAWVWADAEWHLLAFNLGTGGR